MLVGENEELILVMHSEGSGSNPDQGQVIIMYIHVLYSLTSRHEAKDNPKLN
jgi:hypothetical protein